MKIAGNVNIYVIKSWFWEWWPWSLSLSKFNHWKILRPKSDYLLISRTSESLGLPMSEVAWSVVRPATTKY